MKHKAKSEGGKKSKRAISPNQQNELQTARQTAVKQKNKLFAEIVASWGLNKYKKFIIDNKTIVFMLNKGEIPILIKRLIWNNRPVQILNALSQEYINYYIETYGYPDLGPETAKPEWKKMERTPEWSNIDGPC